MPGFFVIAGLVLALAVVLFLVNFFINLYVEGQSLRRDLDYLERRVDTLDRRLDRALTAFTRAQVRVKESQRLQERYAFNACTTTDENEEVVWLEKLAQEREASKLADVVRAGDLQ